MPTFRHSSIWSLPQRTAEGAISGSLYISGKLPTYPSPKPTFCQKWEISVNVGLRGGVGGQFPRNVQWSCMYLRVYWLSPLFVGMFSSALRACSCVTWSFVRSHQCYCSWNTVLSWVRRFFLPLILSTVAPQTFYHPFERPLQDCYLSIRSPASSKLRSWTKVLGRYCVSGAFSNSQRSNPSPHPTNNVGRVCPEFFPSFNYV